MKQALKDIAASALLTIGQFFTFASDHAYKTLSLIFLFLQIAIALKNLGYNPFNKKQDGN